VWRVLVKVFLCDRMVACRTIVFHRPVARTDNTMRPYHKYVAFENSDRELDAELQLLEIAAVWIKDVPNIHGLGTPSCFQTHDFQCFDDATCKLIDRTCIHGRSDTWQQSMVFDVDPDVMAYDYAKMAREMAPLREELLRDRMHPRNASKLVGWGLV
jgi:hypothetical protein